MYVHAMRHISGSESHDHVCVVASVFSDYIDEDRLYTYKYNKERILTPPKTPEPVADDHGKDFECSETNNHTFPLLLSC